MSPAFTGFAKLFWPSGQFFGHPFRTLWTTAQVLFLGHFINQYVFTLSPTFGPSMLPTIAASNDWILTSRLHRRGKGIRVGDVVSVKHPIMLGEGAIKRVIGMPGDFVYRDSPASGNDIMLQVPEGHCWVIGDNLPHSRDSRVYGPIPLALIRGRVVARIIPWNTRKWMENGLQSRMSE